MSEDGFETFEVSPTEEPEPVSQDTSESMEENANENSNRSQTMQESQRCLHVTIVDHNPVIDGTDDSSYIDLRIPLAMVEAGLELIPQKKLGDIDPDMIVQMVKMGAQGELVNISEEKKSISIRIE